MTQKKMRMEKCQNRWAFDRRQGSEPGTRIWLSSPDTLIYFQLCFFLLESAELGPAENRQTARDENQSISESGGSTLELQQGF